MAWADPHSWLSAAIAPSPWAIAITAIVVLSIPLLLHLVIYRSTSTTTLPSFLLVGPSGAGKTALLTLFEQGRYVETRISQTPLSVEVSLPVTTKTGSSKYRSANDPSLKFHKKFLLADTPGHGKLRYHAFDNIVKPQNLKGIIFMVDAADLSGGQDEGLRQTAEYLHDLLLLLQTRSTKGKSSRAPQELPVLIAANKLDLFTALPAVLVKTSLESEITKIRTSREKGLFDSGIDMNEMDAGEEKDWLGGVSDGKFEFSQMEEFNVPVTISGGNVVGSDQPDVEKWWEWIGSNL